MIQNIRVVHENDPVITLQIYQLLHHGDCLVVLGTSDDKIFRKQTFSGMKHFLGVGKNMLSLDVWFPVY